MNQTAHKNTQQNHVFFIPVFHSDFTGKEKDEETGYGYFGARYMDHEMMTMWLSVDPLVDKYPRISPYAYCTWNPIKLIDPDGQEVYINGDQADRAVERLQTEKMTITRDAETGKLSVNIGKYKRRDLSKNERMIYDAINSETVTIQVTASETQIVRDETGTDKNVYYCDEKPYATRGGSFHGATYFKQGRTRCAYTNNFMDVDLLDKNGYNQGVPHEISEQYLLGKMAIKKRHSIKPAFLITGQKNREYKRACRRAIPAKVYSGCTEIFSIISIPNTSVFNFTKQQLPL